MKLTNSMITIAMTEEHMITSSIVKDDFKLSIALPKNYSREHKNYPVIYLLDANIFFGLFTDTVRLLQYGQEIPDVIIVGIGYPEGKDHLYLRNRDFGPTSYDMPDIAGGADKFLRFMNKELKPYIKSMYPIDEKDITLAGDSMSGLFALYTLFHQSDSFKRYIIGSPSMYWDDAITFSYEKSYFNTHKTLNANIFISAGAFEAINEPAFAKMVENVVELSGILVKRNYLGLKLTTHIFENETHLSVIPATFSRGLREVFASICQK